KSLAVGFAAVAAALLLSPLTTGGAYAQEAVPTITTDKFDYQPRGWVQISGAGFLADETVTLQVVHLDNTDPGGAGHEPWTATADGSGTFTSSWYVDPDDSLGSRFVLTAVGGVSGLTTNTVFTDAINPVTLPTATCPSNLGSCTANDVVTTVKAVK